MTASEILALAVAITQGAASAEPESLSAARPGLGVMAYASAPPRPEPEPDFSVPPGGYWRMGEVRAPEPPDGYEKLLTAYIIIPLGTLAMASGAAGTWLSTPGHCTARWAKVGAEPDEDQCKGLYIVNAIRTTYGALMLGSGLVLLGVGLHQRKKWRRWKERGGVSAWWNRGGAGVDLTWRF